MLEKWYSSKKIREILQISSQCLYYMKESGRIEYKKISDKKYLFKLPEDFVSPEANGIAIYARVSTPKQKVDLQNQIELLRQFVVSNGNCVNENLVFSDIASGMNEDRKGLNNLITEVMAGHVSKIIISNKDRLTRFGYGYLENLVNRFNCEIVVVNSTEDSTFEQELTNDLIAIIHHFSMRYYGSRRNKLRTIETKLNKEFRPESEDDLI